MIRWTVDEREDGGVDVRMDGEITATVGFEELAAHAGAKVVLDLDGVRRINSHGVRNLIEFLRGQDDRVEVIHCRPTMVQQFGMVPELAERVRVRSIYVPFECPRCLVEREELVAISGGRPALTPPRCVPCKTPMQLAEPEERYFAFLG